MRRAVTQLNEAIHLEETYAPVHAALSSTYALSLYYKYDVGLPAYDLAALAFAEADRAIELDPELDAGYSSRGYMTGLVGADVDAAQADFDRAAQLAPNNPNAPSWSSRVLVQRGLIAEAYEQARRARDLDPLAAGRRMALLSVAFQLHNYDVVIEESRAAIQLQPELVIAISFEARALALTRRGRACLERELGVYDPVHALCLFTLGQETQAAALAAEAESSPRPACRTRITWTTWPCRTLPATTASLETQRARPARCGKRSKSPRRVSSRKSSLRNCSTRFVTTRTSARQSWKSVRLHSSGSRPNASD
jgi:hypothetical protein